MFWKTSEGERTLLLSGTACTALGLPPQVTTAELAACFDEADREGIEGALRGGNPTVGRRGTAQPLLLTSEALSDGTVVGEMRLAASHGSHHQDAGREAEQNLALGERLAGFGTWSWSAQTGEIWWSEQLYAMHGLDSQDGPPGERWIEWVHPDDRERVLHALTRSLSAGTYSVDYRLIRQDGTRHLHAEARRSPDDDGRLVGVILDVTELWESRQARLASAARLRAMFDASPNAVLLADLDGNVELVNQGVERLFGHRPEALIGRTIAQILPASATAIRSAGGPSPQPRVDGSRHGRDFSTDGVRANGTRFPAEVRVNPLQSGAQGTIVVISDITERLEAERRQQAVQAQAMHAQRLESLGRLASGITHDFNNLVTALLGYAETALDEAPEGPLASDLRDIREVALRAAGLTRQLLAFSRQQPQERIVVAANDVVSQIEQLLSRLLPAGFRLSTQLYAEGTWVIADRVQLDQVLLNLVINARDAMPRGGHIRIIAEPVVLTAEENWGVEPIPPGRYVRIGVADEGDGIPADVVPRVFDPFFTTKSADEGSGLGLSTVLGIVKGSGGYLGVESAQGRGTTFHVLLPQAPEQPPGAC